MIINKNAKPGHDVPGGFSVPFSIGFFKLERKLIWFDQNTGCVNEKAMTDCLYLNGRVVMGLESGNLKKRGW